MVNNEVVQLEVRLDTSEAETSFQKLMSWWSTVEEEADGVGDAMNEALIPDTSGVGDLLNTIQNMADSLDGVVDKISELVELMTPQEESFFDSLVGGVDSFSTLVDGAKGWETLNGAISKGSKKAKENNEAFSIFKALVPETTSLISGMAEKFGVSFSKMGVSIQGFNVGWGWVVAAIIAAIVLLVENWDTISAAVQEGMDFVKSIFQAFDDFLVNLFTTDWTEQFGAFGNVLNGFFAGVEGVWNAIKTVFNGIVTFVKSVFAGDWKGAWDGIVGIFSGIWEGLVAIIKWPINGIIGLINGFIGGIVDGINRVIMLLNCLSFDIPDWEIFGDLAGKKFGFNLELIDAPQIPYLAKGAVLPANKPFLAMVGDQKHGTNIEAPLATIQEAVAVVMEDMIPAMMAGFEAVVNEQRVTRQVVENIQIGDSVIGQAVDRYRRKMAVIKGG